MTTVVDYARTYLQPRSTKLVLAMMDRRQAIPLQVGELVQYANRPDV